MVRGVDATGRSEDVISLLLADDHAVVRAGLRLLLDAEADMSVVGEAGDVPRSCEGDGPSSPRADPRPEHARRIEPGGDPAALAASPETRIVVLTMQNDPVFAREALGAGALGYVLKEAADTELVEAVRHAARGERYVNPGLGVRLATEQGRQTASRRRFRRARPRC